MAILAGGQREVSKIASVTSRGPGFGGRGHAAIRRHHHMAKPSAAMLGAGSKGQDARAPPDDA